MDMSGQVSDTNGSLPSHDSDVAVEGSSANAADDGVVQQTAVIGGSTDEVQAPTLADAGLQAAPATAAGGTMRMASSSANVQCFVRIKPGPLEGSYFKLKDGGEVVLKPPNRAALGPNAQDRFHFKLNGTLGQEAVQDDVFTTVAKPVVDAALDGVSGAVMAYGQTGSGKTYTMTGGRAYAERGIIPRALSYALKKAEAARQESGRDVYAIRLSYLEIYNDRIVDLLRDVDLGAMDGAGEGTAAAGVEGRPPGLPKGNRGSIVAPVLEIREDSRGRIFTPGLRTPVVRSEQDALGLLFEGEANRALAEHALNSGSSRSHAVLTLHFEQKMTVAEATGSGRAGEMAQPGRRKRADSSDDEASGPPMVTVPSKLHFVDLAGSERVGKTNSSGTTLQEAGYINSSLSFLEQCVVALLEKDRSHVPYRSSKLTHLLKEALGGSCVTRLIANVWPDTAHLDESLATLRFAARMMRVKTTPTREMDEGAGGRGGAFAAAERARLVARYESELSMLRCELAQHDAMVLASVANPPGSALQLLQQRAALGYGSLSLADMDGVRTAVQTFVGMGSAPTSAEEASAAEPAPAPSTSSPLSALPTVRHLHAALAVMKDLLLVERRDKQAAVLALSSATVAAGSAAAGGGAQAVPSATVQGTTGPSEGSAAGDSSEGQAPPDRMPSSVPSTTGGPAPVPMTSPKSRVRGDTDKAAALDAWRANEVGAALTAQYTTARGAVKDKKAAYNALASSVNEAKREIDRLLADINRSKEAGGEGGAGPSEALMSALAAAKGTYKSRYNQLQAVKAELDYCNKQAEAIGAKIAAEAAKHVDGLGSSSEGGAMAGALGHGATSPGPSTRRLDSREAYEAGLRRKEERVMLEASHKSPQWTLGRPGQGTGTRAAPS